MFDFEFYIYDRIDQMYCAAFYYEKEAKEYVKKQAELYGNCLVIVRKEDAEKEMLEKIDTWHTLEEQYPSPWSEVLVWTYDGLLELALYKPDDPYDKQDNNCSFYLKSDEYGFYDDYMHETEVYKWHEIPKRVRNEDEEDE